MHLVCTHWRKLHCNDCIDNIYRPFVVLFFFQGEINQGNLKTYQRTVGRKLFIFYHITLNILLSFLIFLTCLFLFYGQYLHFLVSFLNAWFFFIHFFFKGSFTLIVDLAFRLPNCWMDLPRNFPEKKFLNWNILLNVIFFMFLRWPFAIGLRPSLYVVH